jgi:hypothetical protein
MTHKQAVHITEAELRRRNAPFIPITRGGQGRSADELEEGAWQTLLMVALLLAVIAICFFFGGAP